MDAVASAELTSLSASALSEKIATRKISPVDAIEAYLARIAAREPKLQAYVAVYGDEARLAAEAAHKALRAGHAVGPLHGVPIALKDLIEIEGKIVTGGCGAWRNRVATRTATLAKHLIAQGMIVLGKTHTVQFAMAGAPTPSSARPGIRGIRSKSGHRAAPAAARASRSRQASRHGRSAATPAARSACRHRGAA
jgi:aspartyl-tRNA(Asn)/glutamyl-tRNA(Gln) amidotransferase subunit A